MALKIGIKERERRVEVFFYGLFMDEDLLRGKGLEPEGGEIRPKRRDFWNALNREISESGKNLGRIVAP